MKNGKAKVERNIVAKMSPTTQFGQTFLKLDTRCESVRGLNLKEGGKSKRIANSEIASRN